MGGRSHNNYGAAFDAAHHVLFVEMDVDCTDEQTHRLVKAVLEAAGCGEIRVEIDGHEVMRQIGRREQ